MWQQYGLGEDQTPEAVLEETRAYRKDLDNVTRFLESNVVRKKDSTVAKQPLREAYEQWCDDSDEEYRPRQEYKTTVEAYFHKNRVRLRSLNGREVWSGVELTTQGDF